MPVSPCQHAGCGRWRPRRRLGRNPCRRRVDGVSSRWIGCPEWPQMCILSGSVASRAGPGPTPREHRMRDTLIGTSLAQYELQERLGYGGVATVYRGFQPSLGRAVAIKVLPLNRVADPTLPERFRREARLAASLLH